MDLKAGPMTVTRLAAPEMISVVPDPAQRTVSVRVRKARCSPADLRELAVQLLYAADSAEGIQHMADFGYEASDSEDLARLQSAIAEELGWEDDEDELAADYEERLSQVGKILRKTKRYLSVVKT